MCVSKIGALCCAKEATKPQWVTSVWSAQSAGSCCIWETWPNLRGLQISGITSGKFQQYLTKLFTSLTCALLPADINQLNTIKPLHDMLPQTGDMRTDPDTRSRSSLMLLTCRGLTLIPPSLWPRVQASSSPITASIFISTDLELFVLPATAL